MLKKVICIIVSIVFLTTNMSFALSPEPGSNIPDTREGMYAAGQKLWADKRSPGHLDSALEAPTRFRGSRIARLPFTVNFIDPKSSDVPEGWEKNPLLFSSNLIEALEYYRDNEALIPSDLLEIKEGYFEVDEESGELPIARLEASRDGKYTLVVHTKFVQMWNHIIENDIWFEYDLEGLEKRTTSVAWGIFYRLAKHEMMDIVNISTPEPITKGGGHLSSSNESLIVRRDEQSANFLGGRYHNINDAIWLWFLGSYTFTDKVRYDNTVFKERLEWIFTSNEAFNINLQEEFPWFAAYGAHRDHGVNLALAINRQFFSRKKGNSSRLISVPALHVDKELIADYVDRKANITNTLAATGRDSQEVTIGDVIYKVSSTLDDSTKFLRWVRDYMDKLESKVSNDEDFQKLLIAANSNFTNFMKEQLLDFAREVRNKKDAFENAATPEEKKAADIIYGQADKNFGDLILNIWRHIKPINLASKNTDAKSMIRVVGDEGNTVGLVPDDPKVKIIADDSGDSDSDPVKNVDKTLPSDRFFGYETTLGAKPSRSYEEFITPRRKADAIAERLGGRNLVTEFTVFLEMEGPGSEKTVIEEPLLEDQRSRIWEAVNLLHDTQIEVFIPQSITLTDSIKKALTKLESRGVPLKVTRYGNVGSYGKEGEWLLAGLLEENPGAQRIIITDKRVNERLNFLINEHDPRLAKRFKGIRILSVEELSGRKSREKESMFQSRLLMMAILGRLAGDKTAREIEAKNLLREMLEDSFISPSVNLFQFMYMLTSDAQDDDYQGSRQIRERVSYFISPERTISLIKKLETELRIVKEFWTYA